jgi:hypothetical protein
MIGNRYRSKRSGWQCDAIAKGDDKIGAHRCTNTGHYLIGGHWVCISHLERADLGYICGNRFVDLNLALSTEAQS